MTVIASNIVTLHYEDLLKFSKESPGSKEDEDIRQRLINDVACAYGSDGLGILAVKGVPGLQELRDRLLPMAAQIPALPKEDLETCVVEEACYAVGWSHGKEELTPGVPDLSKGSFYANPLVNNLSQAMLERHRASNGEDHAYEKELKRLVDANFSFFAPNVFPDSMPELEGAIFEMGQCTATVGRLVARVCGAYCAEQRVAVDLEQILCDSLNCKARLLHYFEPKPADGDEQKEEKTSEEAWCCGWHNDHGALTGPVPALYLAENGSKRLPFSPDPDAGLYIQSRNGDLIKASLPSDCLGFQIGETFQILSGGLLQATPHAVKQTTTPGVTRETYAVFLEPEYEFPLRIPSGRTVDDCCPPNKANETLKLNSIKSRWNPDINFGEFNNVTLQTFHQNGRREEA